MIKDSYVKMKGKCRRFKCLAAPKSDSKPAVLPVQSQATSVLTNLRETPGNILSGVPPPPRSDLAHIISLQTAVQRISRRGFDSRLKAVS